MNRRTKIVLVLIGVCALVATGAFAAGSSLLDSSASFTIPIDRTVTNDQGATLHLSGTLQADAVIPDNQPPPPPPPPPPPDCDAVLNAGGNIAAFEQTLDPGDIGCLRSGTYGPAVLTNSGTAANPITLTAFPGEQPVLDANGEDHGLTISASHLVISRLDAMNADGEGAALFFAEGNSTDVLIQQNDIGPTESQGIFLEAGTSHYTINRNVIHDIGEDPSRQTHGIYMEGTDHRISNNLIVHTRHGFGIQVYPYDRRIAVVNNTIDDAAFAGIIIGGQTVGGEGRGVSDVDIVNNVITNTDDVAVLCYQEPTNYRIHNNLSFHNHRGGSHCEFGANNLIDVDPDYTQGYRLKAGSPAINAGDDAWTFSPALDGVVRPQGPHVDMGAYEAP